MNKFSDALFRAFDTKANECEDLLHIKRIIFVGVLRPHSSLCQSDLSRLFFSGEIDIWMRVVYVSTNKNNCRLYKVWDWLYSERSKVKYFIRIWAFWILSCFLSYNTFIQYSIEQKLYSRTIKYLKRETREVRLPASVGVEKRNSTIKANIMKLLMKENIWH